MAVAAAEVEALLRQLALLRSMAPRRSPRGKAVAARAGARGDGCREPLRHALSGGPSTQLSATTRAATRPISWNGSKRINAMVAVFQNLSAPSSVTAG